MSPWLVVAFLAVVVAVLIAVLSARIGKSPTLDDSKEIASIEQQADVKKKQIEATVTEKPVEGMSHAEKIAELNHDFD